jgi:hypothetical protein
MVNIALRHILLEHCINVVFRQIKKNFACVRIEKKEYEVIGVRQSKVVCDYLGSATRVDMRIVWLFDGRTEVISMSYGDATIDDLRCEFPGMSESEVLHTVSLDTLEIDLSDSWEW